jgi:hypothetical protein
MGKFYRRLGFYILGLILGGVMVFFIYKDRNLPAVWPSGAVREKLSKSSPVIDSTNLEIYRLENIDSVKLTVFFKNAEVMFSESKAQAKPCPIYVLKGKLDVKGIYRLEVESCDREYKIISLKPVI